MTLLSFSIDNASQRETTLMELCVVEHSRAFFWGTPQAGSLRQTLFQIRAGDNGLGDEGASQGLLTTSD